MNNKTKSKIQQMMDSFVDTGMDTATEWGNDCIKTNLPKVLDQMSSYVKELFASIISQNNNSIRENVRQAIFAGIEIGEDNKEQSLVRAMVDEGIEQEKIRLILQKSNQYLITPEELMELSIQERLKDLRVERGLTLEQLAEQTHLSKSALGSYEGDKFKDISHYALIELAKFYEVTVDYLLGRSETKNHSNADLADLRLSDDMIELLKSGLVDNSLLCELATHPDFPRLMADLEIYVNGVAGKQVQSANAIVDAVSATIMKQHNPGLTDPQLRQLITAHIDDDSFCRYVIQQDINKIALDLREAHKDDFFSVPEDNPLEDFLQTAEETTSPDSDPEQAAMMFICKRLKLNYKKLSEEEKKWLKKIAQKSDLLKNPKPQRGRK